MFTIFLGILPDRTKPCTRKHRKAHNVCCSQSQSSLHLIDHGKMSTSICRCLSRSFVRATLYCPPSLLCPLPGHLVLMSCCHRRGCDGRVPSHACPFRLTQLRPRASSAPRFSIYKMGTVADPAWRDRWAWIARLSTGDVL